jgi:eukaryotic-like serine/threonine-protein kinase
VRQTAIVAQRRDGDPRERYCMVRELGRGSMATVWLAHDRVRGHRVALKRALTPSATGLLRLKREFRIIAPLRHRNLVRLYDLWSDEDDAFFTMEVVDGDDLQRLLRERFPSLSAAAKVRFTVDMATQVLAALGFLHRRGVVHRDVKPSNVMLGVRGTFKLVDFGLLAPVDDRSAVSLDRRGAGTRSYVAPEQARGEPPTPASDMYSLGTVLFEMAGGLAGESQVLDRLCDALLQPDHRCRPDAYSALGLLGEPGRLPASPPQARVPSAPAGDQEVERWLASRLEGVADGAFDVAIVATPAGRGASGVLGWASDWARRAGGLVLGGGGRPGEHVAYNVLDAAVDALASVLLDTLSDADLGRDLALASTAFPVLAGRRRSAAPVSRSRAFDALIRILASLAGAGGVYLLIDDFDRADDQSLAFVDRLLERRPAGVALVAHLDTAAAQPSLRAWLDDHGRIVRRQLACSTRSTLVWSADGDRSARPNQRGLPTGVVAGRSATIAMRTGRQLAKPQDARELGQGRGDVPAVGAERHGQSVRRLLLGGGRLDERELKNATLLRAARR